MNNYETGFKHISVYSGSVNHSFQYGVHEEEKYARDDTVTGEFDHRSSMTATPGKYIYIYIRQDTVRRR